MSIQLYQGDCLELMKDIPDGSVDMVLANIPFATSNTATMIKEGAQAFRMANGSLCVTREWLINNAHLFGA